jgi:hypothetical protein
MSKRALDGLKAYQYKPSGYTILDKWHAPGLNCACRLGTAHAGGVCVCVHMQLTVCVGLIPQHGNGRCCCCGCTAGATTKLPLWLAPNLITLIGTMLLVASYLLSAHYTPDFEGAWASYHSGCGVVWCGVVWCGVVWCGVVWCGVVWCGVVWCGVVWCGCGLWCGAHGKHQGAAHGGQPLRMQSVQRCTQLRTHLLILTSEPAQRNRMSHYNPTPTPTQSRTRTRTHTHTHTRTHTHTHKRRRCAALDVPVLRAGRGAVHVARLP